MKTSMTVLRGVVTSYATAVEHVGDAKDVSLVMLKIDGTNRDLFQSWFQTTTPASLFSRHPFDQSDVVGFGGRFEKSYVVGDEVSISFDQFFDAWLDQQRAREIHRVNESADLAMRRLGLAK
ncbi:hypothetical protein ACI77O_12890 [Pseudomonas tritici]|uniref:hypothetical protein n=1 Tax=Pseudomonas tritici TaxID=2745518 RepID=UPI00387B1CBB